MALGMQQKHLVPSQNIDLNKKPGSSNNNSMFFGTFDGPCLLANGQLSGISKENINPVNILN